MVGRLLQDRQQALLGLGHALLLGERRVQRGQRRGLDAEVGPRQGPQVVALEMVVGRPPRGGGEQGAQELVHPRRVAVGLGRRHRLLSQQVDGEGRPRPPQPVQALHRLGRGGPHDELVRHAGDVPPGHGGREVLT